MKLNRLIKRKQLKASQACYKFAYDQGYFDSWADTLEGENKLNTKK